MFWEPAKERDFTLNVTDVSLLMSTFSLGMPAISVLYIFLFVFGDERLRLSALVDLDSMSNGLAARAHGILG